MKKNLLMVCFIGILTLIVLPVGTVQAWVFIGRWQTSSASYGFATSYPTGDWRVRAANAAQAWTDVPSSSWAWSQNLATPNGMLYYQADDGYQGNVAITIWYTCGSYLCGFRMNIDNAEIWYIGTGSPNLNQADLWGALTHEFGHAPGLGHPTVGCGGSSEPTMCPGFVWGTNRWRSLEADDRTGISSIYP